MSAKATVTVSGPGVDRACPDGIGPALSYAITCASRDPKTPTTSTYYVRDEHGETVGRVERHGRAVLVFGAERLAAERERQRREEREQTPFVPMPLEV